MSHTKPHLVTAGNTGFCAAASSPLLAGRTAWRPWGQCALQSPGRTGHMTPPSSSTPPCPPQTSWTCHPSKGEIKTRRRRRRRRRRMRRRKRKKKKKEKEKKKRRKKKEKEKEKKRRKKKKKEKVKEKRNPNRTGVMQQEHPSQQPVPL
ncbi:chromatin assembly factor 1 subunit A-like [Lepus europaeus]|uniref:chromatin assembly factor 1 subunit A-like n=1 Tax=Lepus europaeus TaxID=9983 RepID=UPI002B469739|nr:chromatin assembly factor 1 subunit A-like [Lepus europaeus]